MPREVYAQWAAFDQYGMYAVFGLVIFFRARRRACSESAFDAVLRVISAIVGGYPMV